MIDLKGFRKANKITQMQLADYLGVNHSFIGNIECGRSLLPKEKMDMILTNTMGWDTSSLLVDNDAPMVSARVTGNGTAKVSINNSRTTTTTTDSSELAMAKAQIDALKKEIESLTTQLGKVELEKERYWEMIQRLTK